MKPTPILYGEDAVKFMQKVEKGLRHPVGPVPTPKAKLAAKKIMEDIKRRTGEG